MDIPIKNQICYKIRPNELDRFGDILESSDGKVGLFMLPQEIADPQEYCALANEHGISLFMNPYQQMKYPVSVHTEEEIDDRELDLINRIAMYANSACVSHAMIGPQETYLMCRGLINSARDRVNAKFEDRLYSMRFVWMTADTKNVKNVGDLTDDEYQRAPFFDPEELLHNVNDVKLNGVFVDEVNIGSELFEKKRDDVQLVHRYDKHSTNLEEGHDPCKIYVVDTQIPDAVELHDRIDSIYKNFY